MSLQVPKVSSLTSRLSEDVKGLCVGDEKTVTVTNTSLNVENSTVHIGNVIHHHIHIPTDQTEFPTDNCNTLSDDDTFPEKTDITRNEARNKYYIFTNNKKTCIVVTLIFVTLLLAGIFSLLNIINVPTKSREPTPPENEDPDPKPSESFGDVTELQGCKIFEEETWGIKRNLEDIELKHPVPLIIISHTATPFCNNTKSCRSRVKQIQEYHISTGSPDIGYNFIVGGDANIYVGRGWKARNFHLGNHSIGINLIGNFFRDEFTPSMIKCVKAVMDYGVTSKILEDDYKIVCHNQTNDKVLSPGPNVYAEVKKWPHFMAGRVNWNYLYGV